MTCSDSDLFFFDRKSYYRDTRPFAYSVGSSARKSETSLNQWEENKCNISVKINQVRGWQSRSIFTLNCMPLVVWYRTPEIQSGVKQTDQVLRSTVFSVRPLHRPTNLGLRIAAGLRILQAFLNRPQNLVETQHSCYSRLLLSIMEPTSHIL